MKRTIFCCAFLSVILPLLPAQAITRAESLRIAESFVQCRWQATEKNLWHGKDAQGVDVQTPDRAGQRGEPAEDCWLVNSGNIGVAYKWGGYDTPASFVRGVAAGKAAGDIYTAEKRRLNDRAVSDLAVGIDCSGFVCRSWKTERRYSTSTLPSICRQLAAASELQPADAMDQPGGHILLFVKWLDPEKTRALFYEAAPFSKTLSSERNVAEMIAQGFLPLRYREMRG